MKEITLSVPQGVGDILWIYQKFSPYFDKINFNICILSHNFTQYRAKGFVELWPKTGDVEFKQIGDVEYASLISATYSMKAIMECYDRGVRCFDYSCNRPLEEGIRLEDIDKDYPLEETVNITAHYCTLPFQDYITLYICGTNKNGDVWNADQWVHFVKEYYLKFNLNYPIVIIGATYDEVFLREVADKLYALGINNHVCISAYPANVCYIIKHSLFFIGYQSGLSVLADNYDVPQFMIYFNQLEKMMYTWPKHKNIASGYFHATLFRNSPDVAVDNLNFNPNERTLTEHKKDAFYITTDTGDFLTIVSHMTDEERLNVDTIYWATRARRYISEIVKKTNMFPNLRREIIVYNKFNDHTPLSFPDRKTLTTLAKEKRIPCDRYYSYEFVKDYTVANAVGKPFNNLNLGEFSCEMFDFPYVFIHPYTPNISEAHGSLNDAEWQNIIRFLENNNLHAVVVGIGEIPPPTHPRIVSRLNYYPIMSAIECLKRSVGYVGCPSMFSILAPKLVNPANIAIKADFYITVLPEFNCWYAPYANPSMIMNEINLDGRRFV